MRGREEHVTRNKLKKVRTEGIKGDIEVTKERGGNRRKDKEREVNMKQGIEEGGKEGGAVKKVARVIGGSGGR